MTHGRIIVTVSWNFGSISENNKLPSDGQKHPDRGMKDGHLGFSGDSERISHIGNKHHTHAGFGCSELLRRF
jgi:hypothetical protein